jgi:NADH:ubiquinone oxidoreductase subunit 3 (subunit A)
MNWKQGFISGIVLSVFIAILTPIGQVIIHTVIAPNFFENFITYSVEKGVLNKENAEAYFNLTSYIVQSLFFALSVGVVTAALVAFFIKSKEN